MIIEADRPAPKASTLGAEDARGRLAALRLSPVNRQLTEYWLSLAKPGTPPRRDSFDPAHTGELLRGCALFDVIPGRSVTCRIAGTVVRLVFGSDVAGQDWLAFAPARHRAQRLARYSAVAQGAIGIARRVAMGIGEDPVRIEEVMLPFADVAPDGTRPVLVHTDWRPEPEQWFGVDPTYAKMLADDFFLVELD